MTRRGSFVRISWVLSAAALLALCGVAHAQSDPAPPPPPPGHHGGFLPVSDDAMAFVGFEAGLAGKTVTGAPFSATFSTDTTQALADCNQIQHSATGTFARDSQGRTRRDLGTFVECGDTGRPDDIDTPADLARITAAATERQ